MPTPQELEQKFWKALKSDMTVMLGLDGVEDGHARPMTAQLEHESHGPIWFFTVKDNALVQKLGKGNRAIATFASKGHDLFATIHGTVCLDNDRAVIERLWKPFCRRLVPGRQGRSEARAPAPRPGARRDLGRCIELRRRHQAPPRHRPETRLQGQGRRGELALGLRLRKRSTTEMRLVSRELAEFVLCSRHHAKAEQAMQTARAFVRALAIVESDRPKNVRRMRACDWTATFGKTNLQARGDLCSQQHIRQNELLSAVLGERHHHPQVP
jgi:general stress protein 26